MLARHYLNPGLACARRSALQALLDAGAGLEVQKDDGDTPLHQAAGNGHVAVIQASLAGTAGERWCCIREVVLNQRGGTAAALQRGMQGSSGC